MVTQVTLKNHPGMWLAPDAAASLERFEAAMGVLHINSAGRSFAEQDVLLKRWNMGGASNRPPYLFKPAPHGVSWHERGEALDTDEITRFKRDGLAYGWVFEIPGDVVHAQYHPDRDTHKIAVAGSGTAIGYSDNIKAEQAWLISIGYNLGPAGPDGIKGQRTTDAFKAYQTFLRAYGYTGAIDGEWGPATQAAHQRYYDSKHVATPPAATSPALTGYKQIQAALNKFGYNLAVDGVWGNASHNALGDFQRKHGLRVDYLVGPATRAKLGI